MGKRRKFAKRLQKAVNHTNKTIMRLYQLDEVEEPKIMMYRTEGGERYRTVWWFLAQELEGLRRRMLFSAQMRDIELDHEGMPK